MQTRTVVLCDDASHCILEWFSETCELLDASFNNLLAPLVDFFLLIDDIVGANDLLDGCLCDLFNLLRIEVSIIFKVVHSCSSALFILFNLNIILENSNYIFKQQLLMNSKKANNKKESSSPQSNTMITTEGEEIKKEAKPVDKKKLEIAMQIL